MRPSMILLISLVGACGRPAAEAVGSDTVGTRPARHDEVAGKEELVQLEKKWADALQAHDTAFFERTLAEDFLATTSEGTSDRAAMLKAIGDTNVTFLNTGDEDQKVRLYEGGNVGVVTGRVRGVMQMGKQKVSQLVRYTEVFAKRDGGWQAVAAHYSPLIAPK